MAALYLKLIRPNKLHHLAPSPPPPHLRGLSSAADPPPSSTATPPPDSDTNSTHPPSSHPPRDYASYFNDIKGSLKSSPSPPRKIPENPPPPPASSIAGATSSATGPTSFYDIQKHLASYSLNNSIKNQNHNINNPSMPPPISFQELLKNNVLPKPGYDTNDTGRGKLSFDSIRESLRQFDGSPTSPARQGFSLRSFQESFRKENAAQADSLPESIFGKELRERRGEETLGDNPPLKTEFLKSYSHEDLGKKLKQLRPDAAKKGEKEDWFSLHELNERLAKLRELEERETEMRMGGMFKDLRAGLSRIQEADAAKKAKMMRWPVHLSLREPTTPQFMLKPPQEHLLENVRA